MNNIKISLRNYSKDKERYKKYRKQLLELLNENNSKLNFDLKIIARILDTKTDSDFGEETNTYAAMHSIVQDDRALIEIDSMIFDYFEKNDELMVRICLFHEFCHIDDLHYIASFPYFKGRAVDSMKLTSINEINIFIGILFWTEYYAYSKTFLNFKKFDQYISIYDLEKNYISLQKQITKGKTIENKKLRDKLLIGAIIKVNVYTHFVAMNLASTKFGDKRKIKDKNKIFDEETHEIVTGMLEKFSYYANELTKYRSDNKFITYLRKLGDYINFEYNEIFDVKLAKKDNYFVHYI